MTAPGLVISTDASTCVSISLYPSSQNAESLLASKRQYKGFHLEAHVSFEHAKPRKPWYLIWKQMSTSNSSRSPISHPHSDFEPDAREIRESLGDLTSASPETHKSAEKFTQMLFYYCCWLCFCQFLTFEQNKSIGCFSDIARYYNSEVINKPHIRKQQYMCVTEYGFPKRCRYLCHFLCLCILCPLMIFLIAFIISVQNMYGNTGLWSLRAEKMIIFEVMTDGQTSMWL